VSFTASVTDLIGQTSNVATATINITDDAPTFTQIDYATVGHQANDILTGTHNIVFGADGEGQINLSPLTTISNLNYSSVLHNPDGSSTMTAGTGTATTGFFTLAINPDGTYVFDLINPTPVTQNVVNFSGVQGAQATQSLTIGEVTFTPGAGETIKPTSSGFGIVNGNWDPGESFTATFAGNPVHGVSLLMNLQSKPLTVDWHTNMGDSGQATLSADGNLVINATHGFSSITLTDTSLDSSESAKINGFSFSQDVLPVDTVLNFQVAATDHDGSISPSQILGVHLVGGVAGDTISGTPGNDAIAGTSASETIIGGAGNDTLFGGLGSDTFKWSLADQGTDASHPAADVVKDFSIATIGSGGDVLNLHDLLTGGVGVTSSPDAAALDAYLDFSANAKGDVVISVHPTGSGGPVTQLITLEGVTLAELHALLPGTVGATTDQDIISKLIAHGNLKVDG